MLERHTACSALSAVLSYVEVVAECGGDGGRYVLSLYNSGCYMRLDATAQRALNVLPTRTVSHGHWIRFRIGAVCEDGGDWQGLIRCGFAVRALVEGKYSMLLHVRLIRRRDMILVGPSRMCGLLLKLKMYDPRPVNFPNHDRGSLLSNSDAHL